MIRSACLLLLGLGVTCGQTPAPTTQPIFKLDRAFIEGMDPLAPFFAANLRSSAEAPLRIHGEIWRNGERVQRLAAIESSKFSAGRVVISAEEKPAANGQMQLELSYRLLDYDRQPIGRYVIPIPTVADKLRTVSEIGTAPTMQVPMGRPMMIWARGQGERPQPRPRTDAFEKMIAEREWVVAVFMTWDPMFAPAEQEPADEPEP